MKRIIVTASPKRIIRQLKYVKQLKHYIYENNDLALIHLHEPALLLVALFAKRRGIRVIFDSHEDYYQQIKMRKKIAFANIIIAKLYKAYEKFVCKRIDAVVFPCEMEGKQAFDYKVKRLVYLDNFPILNGEKCNEYIEQNSDKFYACYVGTISRERGILNVIKAWKKANVKGIIAGKYDCSEVKSYIENMQEYEGVDYRGYCDSIGVKRVYEEASVGMATLLNYGQYHKSHNLPTKVYEYMMCCIPTIIYRNAFVESVMKEYEFGIMVNPEDIGEISEALEYLRDNPQKALQMGRNGRIAVETKYNWCIEEKKLFELYTDVLITDN
ncbi:MAG: glycosyltransferase [Bacillaceae bacterium]